MSNAPPLDPSKPSAPFALGSGEEALHAHTLLRHLAGKRIVCAGQWRGREVVAKIYIDRRRKKVHAQREAEGARALHARGIPTAALLHEIHDAEMEVLIFERIMPAESALERWQSAQDPEQQLQVLRALVLTAAALHESGLLQEDLHLRNFLFSHDNLYSLDAGSILVRKKSIARAAAFDNLGLLFAQFHATYDALARTLYADYARIRQWPCEERDFQKLQKAIERRRTKRKHDHLDKLFRSSSAFLAHRDARRFWMLDRTYDSPALRKILADPDAPLKEARILKAGQSSTVGLIETDGLKLVIKRYNIKNSWHGIKRALRPTRAAISWRNAHALLLSGLHTPKPIAILEKKRGPFRQAAYFICEYVEAPDCYYLLHGDTLNKTEQDGVVERMCALFDQLGQLKIGHGDTKATNFLIGDEAVSIIDLDALREYENPRHAARAHERDIQRFLRNWDDLPLLRAQFEQELKSGDKQP